jgi:hypothetical protein
VAISREQLLGQAGPPEADVDLPGVGVVRVRGLTRIEVLSVRKAADSAESVDGPRLLVLERKLIAAGMVDPQLSEDDVRAWQNVCPAGQLEPVTEKIQELSGLAEGSEKAAFQGVREQPGA